MSFLHLVLAVQVGSLTENISLLKIRGQLAGTAAFVDWMANFAIIELFPWGPPAVMLVFAGLSILAVTFVSRWMPETKGPSLEEITALFDEQASTVS